MAQTSPAFIFSGNSGALEPKVVAATTSFSATLASLAGITQVEWSISSTDETSVPGNYALVVSGSKGETVTMTSLGLGTAGLLQCRVNGGVDPVTGNSSDAMTATAKFCVLTANGLAVLTVNEERQHNFTFGWIPVVNAPIRALSSLAAITLTATAPLKINGNNVAHTLSAGNLTFTIAPATNLLPGSMSAAHKALLDTATATPTSNALVTYDSSSGLESTYFLCPGGFIGPFTGILRVPNNSTIIVANDSFGNDSNILAFDSLNKLSIGDNAHVANVVADIKTGGTYDLKINGSSKFTVSASTVNVHSSKLTNVGTPTSASDGASKSYVDAQQFYSFLALPYADIVAAATPGQTVMFINIDNGANGSGGVNNGSGAVCPNGGFALGGRYQLNVPFVAAGATLIKMSIGVSPGFKMFTNVGIDGSGPPPATSYSSFNNDDCGVDVSVSFFQVRIEITGGPDLQALTAGDLVIRCFGAVHTLL